MSTILKNPLTDHLSFLLDSVLRLLVSNRGAICFVKVLAMAKEIGVLQVGTVSVDGTKMA